MTLLEISLPWPPSILSPNSRAHWAKRHKARKKYKSDCFYLARAHGVPDLHALSTVPLIIVFHPPDRHKRDLDNMLASIKAALDSLSLAWGVDDSVFALTISKSSPVKNGCVKVSVTA